MATPPTFVAEYEVANWQVTTSPKTATPTTAAGDILVVYAGSESGASTIATPTGNSQTYALAQSDTGNSSGSVYLWTTTATAATGWTLSAASGGTAESYGFSALRFSGSAGIGASAKAVATSGQASVALTTTADNSAVVVFVVDGSALNGATRSWIPVNSITPTAANGLERTYSQGSTTYAVYGAYYSDVGAAGAKTVGVSVPTDMVFGVVAVEVKGTAGGGGGGGSSHKPQFLSFF